MYNIYIYKNVAQKSENEIPMVRKVNYEVENFLKDNEMNLFYKRRNREKFSIKIVLNH